MDVILALVQKYPQAAGLLAAMYVAGVCFKPLFSLLHTYVDATQTIKDNEVLAAVEASKAYQVIQYVLDWAVRIKLPVVPK